MKNIHKMKSGYTLIEIVIYIAVLAMISIIVVNSFIVSLSSSKIAFSKRNLQEAGINIIERMTREIRDAGDIVDANSIFDNNPGAIEVDGANIIKFNINSGSLDMYKDDVLYGSLSGPKVTVSSLVFRKIVTPTSEAVKIELVLMDSLGRSANFYNTVVLRGSY